MKRRDVRPGRDSGACLPRRPSPTRRTLAYARLRLDTVPGMETAQALYERLGFCEIAPYPVNPVPGTRYLELEL